MADLQELLADIDLMVKDMRNRMDIDQLEPEEIITAEQQLARIKNQLEGVFWTTVGF